MGFEPIPFQTTNRLVIPNNRLILFSNFISTHKDTFSNSPLPITESPAELHEINDNAVMISPSTIDENSHLSVRTDGDENTSEEPFQQHEQEQQAELFDMDESSHPGEHATGVPPPTSKGIKIVLSSLVANNLNSNRNLSNVVNNVNINDDSSNLESANKLDTLNDHNECHVNQAAVEDHYEMPDIQYEVKSSLKGVKFSKNLVPVKRGLENSGLCSIM